MGGLARISFKEGAFFTSAETPYEREMLFEFTDQSAKIQQCVRVELDRRQWTVRRQSGPPPVCAACAHEAVGLIYTVAGCTLCARCARHESGPDGGVRIAEPSSRKPLKRREGGWLDEAAGQLLAQTRMPPHPKHPYEHHRRRHGRRHSG